MTTQPVSDVAAPTRQPSDLIIAASDVVKTYRTDHVTVQALARRLVPGGRAARWSPSWGRPAAARRPCSTASAASTPSTKASSSSTARTSTGCPTTAARSSARARWASSSSSTTCCLSSAPIENVELPLLVSGTKSKEARERALTALDLVHLRDWAKHRPAAALRRTAPARHDRPGARQRAGHRLGR